MISTENKANQIVRAFAQCHGILNPVLGEAGAAGIHRHCLEQGTRCGNLNVARLKQAAQALLQHRVRLIDELRRVESARVTAKRAAALPLFNRRLTTGGV